MKKAVVARVEKLWLSTREAMAYLDCSRDFLETLRTYPGLNVYRDFLETLRTYPGLNVYKLGRSVYYEKASIDMLIRKNRY